MRQRVFYDPDCKPNMGVDRSVSVFADFTDDDGLTIDGSDLTSWPERDFVWSIRVAADQTENLRKALGAKPGESTLDVVVGRFEDGTLSPSLGLSAWLTEHGLQFSRSEQWQDN